MASGRRNSARSRACGTETAGWCSSRRSGLSELRSSSGSSKGSSTFSFATDVVSLSSQSGTQLRTCQRTVRTAQGMSTLPQSARARVLIPQQAVAVEPDGGLHDRGTDKQLCQTEAGGEEEHESPCARCRELQAHGLGDHNANDDGELGEDAWIAS